MRLTNNKIYFLLHQIVISYQAKQTIMDEKCIFMWNIICDKFKLTTEIAKFMGPKWGPPGSCWPQMGPIMAPWTLLLGKGHSLSQSMCGVAIPIVNNLKHMNVQTKIYYIRCHFILSTIPISKADGIATGATFTLPLYQDSVSFHVFIILMICSHL